jgi:predicted ArsR family transcriptional regulator
MPQLPLSERPLTELQEQTLEFMQAHFDRTGRWPTTLDMAKAFCVHKRTIRERLQNMVAKGAIEQPYFGGHWAIVAKGGAQSQ